MMTPTRRTTGQKTVIKFNNVLLSDDFRDFSEDEKVKMIDASAGDDTYTVTLPGQTESSIKLDFLDTTDETVFKTCVPRRVGTLQWFPNGGTTTGRQCLAVVASRSRKNPYADVRTVSVEFNIQGPISDFTTRR
ncbi:MAG: hypothetical protein ACPGWR_00970 [Ardenticatenaceae bacterium]